MLRTTLSLNFTYMDVRLKTMIGQQGLLKVPLFHKQPVELEHYALLNGTKNNLCLDGQGDENPLWYRKMAWSSGNNTYLSFKDGKCFIFRFDKPQVESYEQRLIFENSDKFIDYLGRSSCNIENSIVSYVLRTYRQLRNEIRTDNSGTDSLRALLYLLAYSRDRDNVDLSHWGLSVQDSEIIETVDASKWNMIVERFLKGVLFTDHWLQPDIDLMLRHTAGKLFEEANYIAYLPSQLTLFPSEKIKYSNETMQDGAYFTPSYVARSIVEEVLRHVNLQEKDQLTIFDPACGASGFLVETLRQLKKAHFNKHLHVIGWDKAATAVMISKFVLSFEKQEWEENLLTFDIVHCDSLDPNNTWPQNVDILLMNPPFLSWDRMINSPDLREIVKNILPDIPKANLSAAFLNKAVEAISYGGVLGAVVPTRLLNDQNYEPLRNHLSENMSIKLIGGLGSYVFETVLAYTSMIVASKEIDDSSTTTILWTNNKVGIAEEGLKALRKHRYTDAIIEETDYSVYEASVVRGQKNWRIDNYKNLSLKKRLNEALRLKLFRTVGELFDIQQGVRTGANSVFVVSEDFVLSLPNNERPYFRPSVDNIAIDMGHLYKINYMFYPYTKGLEPIDSEERLQQLLPITFQKLLEPAKKKLSERPSIRGKNNWWELTRHRNYLEDKKPKMISTEFGHSGSFAIDYSGEYVVERGYIWVLNNRKFRAKLKYEEAYLAFFVSDYMNTLLDFYGERLAGAEVYKLGLSYVKNVPLPDLSLPIYEKYIPKLRHYAQLMKDGVFWETNELNALIKEMMNYA